MANESETKEQILTKYLNAIGENTSFFNCAIEAMQEYSSIQNKELKTALLKVIERLESESVDDHNNITIHINEIERLKDTLNTKP